jgi:hypothetical protein
MEAIESYRKLNTAVKAKWLKALRSGKYNQTKGQLKDETGYCCLGVLCEVKGRLAPFVDDNLFGDTDQKGVHIDLKIENLKVKMPKVSGKALISPKSCWIPTWVDRKAQKVLADMNDNGSDFKEIATWISKNL